MGDEEFFICDSSSSQCHSEQPCSTSMSGCQPSLVEECTICAGIVECGERFSSQGVVQGCEEYGDWMNQREDALNIVSKHGHLLEHVSEILKDDRDIVLAAISENGNPLAGSSIVADFSETNSFRF